MWAIGEISNKSSQEAFVTFVVSGGQSVQASQLSDSLGNASVALGGEGAIEMTDSGAQPGGQLPNAVTVQAGSQTWTWWYEDGSVLDVALNDDSFVLTGAEQTIAGKFETPISLGTASSSGSSE